MKLTLNPKDAKKILECMEKGVSEDPARGVLQNVYVCRKEAGCVEFVSTNGHIAMRLTLSLVDDVVGRDSYLNPQLIERLKLECRHAIKERKNSIEIDLPENGLEFQFPNVGAVYSDAFGSLPEDEAYPRNAQLNPNYLSLICDAIAPLEKGTARGVSVTMGRYEDTPSIIEFSTDNTNSPQIKKLEYVALIMPIRIQKKK